MSSSAAAFSPDHLSPSDQLCVVLCNFCDTALGVSVPRSSLFKSVIVQCGHCYNLLLVNMPGLLLPAAIQPNPAPEKRRRDPSPYLQFRREEIKRIRAANPDISHKEAFSAAAKNYFSSSIHSGLMPDQPGKKPTMPQQERDDVLPKDGFSAQANVGHSLLNKGKEKKLD